MSELTRDRLSANEEFLHHLKKLSDAYIALSTRELFYLSVQVSFLYLTGTYSKLNLDPDPDPKTLIQKMDLEVLKHPLFHIDFACLRCHRRLDIDCD